MIFIEDTPNISKRYQLKIFKRSQKDFPKKLNEDLFKKINVDLLKIFRILFILNNKTKSQKSPFSPFRILINMC